MLHYNPQHVSSSTLLIFRRTNCIITASGIVTLCKQPYYFVTIYIYMLHYNPQHVSSSTLFIFRRTNCIITASGIVTLCKQPYYSVTIYLYIYICYITILNMFRAVPCSSSGQIVLLQPLVPSLSVNSRTVCRLTADCSPLSTCILYGCLQRVTVPEVVIIQFVLLKMSKVLLETC